MVKGQQIRRLFMHMKKEKYQYQAVDKAGMTERTAYKYIKAGKLPRQLKREHDWKTRVDPFVENWEEILEMLAVNPGQRIFLTGMHYYGIITVP